jgi:uncharacterized phiE125 gp8 family phage protein
MTVYNEELVSGTDDLIYDVTLGDPVTNTPLIVGTVTVSLCQPGTTTPLGANSTVTLTHQTGGRWVGVHDANAFVVDLPAVGGLFDKVLVVAGARTDLLARCRRVSILNGRLLRDAKRYLRIQTDEENVLLSSLINSAIAACEAWLGRPIDSRVMLFYDEVSAPTSRLLIPVTPVGQVVSITGEDGTSYATASVRLNPNTGTLTRDTLFEKGTYQIQARVGLSEAPYYALGVSAVIAQAVLDVVTDLYQRRNAAASREAEGGGIAVDYVRQARGVSADMMREDLLPERTMALLAPFRQIFV